jgi:hypothetical protein
MKKSGKPSTTPLLDTLKASESRNILMQLVRSSPDIAAKAEKLARAFLVDVESEEIADSLARDLSYPTIEEVWETSGRTRYGYIEPGERAYEILEEILDEYITDMNTYLRRGMVDQSREYCAGIVLGIGQFCMESHADILEEVPDFSNEADLIRRNWEEKVNDETQIQLLAEYLQEKGVEREPSRLNR